MVQMCQRLFSLCQPVAVTGVDERGNSDQLNIALQQAVCLFEYVAGNGNVVPRNDNDSISIFCYELDSLIGPRPLIELKTMEVMIWVRIHA